MLGAGLDNREPFNAWDTRAAHQPALGTAPFWAMPRCSQAAALQWARRARGPLPFVVQEVHQRMMQRAQVLRPPEGGVLHQGWLHPELLHAATATLFAGRPAQALVPRTGVLPRPPWWQRLLWRLQRTSPPWIERLYPLPATASAPASALALASQSMAVVWCPLGLDAMANPRAVLAEWFRVLKPGGCVFFSAMGPDTAQVLHPFAKSLGSPMADFVDMHDWGDALAQVGFADPVMEMERLHLHYASPQALLADWRAWCGNSLQGRPQGLVGQARRQAALAELEAQRRDDGRVHLHLELLYGHAWKVQRQRPGAGGEVRIDVADIGGRKR